MQSILLANFINYIHRLLVLFILSGLFYIPNKYLPFFIIFVILVVMGWNDLYGSCFLTKLEYYFRTGIWSNLSAKDDNGPEFFRPFIKSITGINMNRKQADKLNNILFISIIIISIIKYCIFLL